MRSLVGHSHAVKKVSYAKMEDSFLFQALEMYAKIHPLFASLALVKLVKDLMNPLVNPSQAVRRV
jgi:hypothetical protein